MPVLTVSQFTTLATLIPQDVAVIGPGVRWQIREQFSLYNRRVRGLNTVDIHKGNVVAMEEELTHKVQNREGHGSSFE